MFMTNFVRLFLTLLLSSLIGFGIYDYLKNFDDNECSMTYMRQNPGLIPVNLPQQIRNEFKKYKLYLYCEGYDCQDFEKLKFTTSGYIPVLFIPGNADSHMQVRSMASIGLEKSRKTKYQKRNIKFLYFAISYNEEFSALYGPLLEIQGKFAKLCIEHILSLFENVKPEHKRPKTVLLIGNSMGGVVTRGIFLPSDDNFSKKNLVHTIITQATPHVHPVVNFDSSFSEYYDKVNKFWLNKSEESLNNVVIASLYGGTRDILVRSGLANVNQWKTESAAAVISGYTVSMPHVWRSIDHRCMAWCRELVMAANRALFQIVDPKTDQIMESRADRERIFKYHFERDVAQEDLSSDNKILSADKLESLDVSKIQFEYNDYNQLDHVYSINLKDVFKKDDFDSLFVYTNINEQGSFLLCKDFKSKSEKEYECSQFKDIMFEFGRSIPPYFESIHKESTLKTMNMVDLKKLATKENYAFLVFKIPILTLNKGHQKILKLDWYSQKQRFNLLDVPTLLDRKTTFGINNVVFQRFYLPKFSNVLQAFNLKRILENQAQKETKSCDQLLIKKINSKSAANKPLSASTLMIQFYEPTSQIQSKQMNEQIYHSQAIQSKTKDLLLRLSVNQYLEQETIPFIDFVQFDVKHLVKNTPSNMDELNKNKCIDEHKLELEVNYMAILGQYIRFFMVFVPAFIVAILQFYDFLVVRIGTNDMSRYNNDYKSNYMLMNRSNTYFAKHLLFSVLLTFISIVLNSGIVKNVFTQAKISFISNDFILLEKESIWIPFLPFLFYWTAYAILSTASFFISLIYFVYSFILHRIILNIFGFLKSGLVQNLLSVLHLIITICASVFVSSFAHCGIFYAELIRLAANNPRFTENAEKNAKNAHIHLRAAKSQTKMMLFYLVLVLNLPSILVWSKSVESQDVKPLNAISYDSGYLVAIIALIIYVIYVLKDKLNFLNQLFTLNSSLLSVLVWLNCLATVFYSSVNIYRLQYFILIHLFLMVFSSLRDAEKPKKE